VQLLIECSSDRRTEAVEILHEEALATNSPERAKTGPA
jgi:hypothetical protein